MSVVELVVAMAVLSVLMAVFVAAVTLMTSSARRVYAVATVVTQGRAVVDALGRQLSYASAVNLPVRVGNAWYLEFSSDAMLAGTDPRCTQWRYQSSTSLLQYRTWDAVTLAATGWTTLSPSVVNDPAVQPPFTLLPGDAGFAVTRVAVDLRLRSAVGSPAQTQGQYALRNSGDAPVPTASTVCTQLGRP